VSHALPSQPYSHMHCPPKQNPFPQLPLQGTVVIVVVVGGGGEAGVFWSVYVQTVKRTSNPLRVTLSSDRNSIMTTPVVDTILVVGLGQMVIERYILPWGCIPQWTATLCTRLDRWLLWNRFRHTHKQRRNSIRYRISWIQRQLRSSVYYEG